MPPGGSGSSGGGEWSQPRSTPRTRPSRQAHPRHARQYVRAEPIAALYEQDLVHHAGAFPTLEAQMATFVPGEPSPDRLDALVHAITVIMEGTTAQSFAGFAEINASQWRPNPWSSESDPE